MQAAGADGSAVTSLPPALVSRDRATATALTRVMLHGGGLLLLVVTIAVQAFGTQQPVLRGYVLVAVMLAVSTFTGRRHVGTVVGDAAILLAMALGVVSVAVMWATWSDLLPTGQTLMYLPVVMASLLFHRPVVAVVVAGCGACLVLVPWLSAPAPDVLVLVHGLTLAAGAVLLAVVMVRVTEQRAHLTAELERLAAVDALTGLVTRRVLDDALAVAVESAATSRGSALVLVDLDDFKAVNDRYGHPVGDQALCHVAALVRAAMGVEGATVCRLGGDELAALLTGCSPEQGRRLAESLLHAVRTQPLRLQDGRSVPLRVSIGLAHAPVHAGSTADLYRQADRALYRAKESGRDAVVVAGGDGAVLRVVTAAEEGEAQAEVRRRG